ncbi:MAG: hypothetical protein DRO15_08170 [Thermoprotei archaeon]|nr:MAG: hypothetical protein DRO15_08170 [Thermoprotei archaeon]
MPLFIVYPAKPAILKQIIDVLGEPSDVKVEVSIEDRRLRDVFKPDDVKYFTVAYHCKPAIERTLELYREYYKSYVDRLKVKAREEKLRTILSFKATWYIDDFSAEFDGFKLKLSVGKSLEKVIEILKLFKDRSISIEVNLSSRKP